MTTATHPDGTPLRGRTYAVSVAPMMDRTHRYCRFFLRQITRHSLLYTEMVTTGAVLRGDRERLLGYSEEEKPLVLQLGGDDPRALAACARIAADWGYDEVNLNVGCPSERVQKGCFGARLMAEPQRVADAVAAMRAAVPLPITVKHRIGIDDLDRYEDMLHFVTTVAAAGCDRFSVHARKAWLSGLSPKENREIPPLRYGDVHRLKRELPQLRIEINGGIRTLDAIATHLTATDGVMIGRAAYENPFLFATVDRAFFGASEPAPTRRAVAEAMLPYLAACCAQGVPAARVLHPMINLFAGQPGARLWRRHLSEYGHRSGAGAEVLRDALARLPTPVLDTPPTTARHDDNTLMAVS